MKAYKFRTVENLEFVIDILINKRLFCCEARSLNDIREGDIRVGNDEGNALAVVEFGQAVTDALRSYRVCSLSKIFDNHLLWAYYAGGFTGLAIEVDLPPSEATEVRYDDEFLYLSDFIGPSDINATVRTVLSRKSTIWNHEQEVRVITTDTFYNLPEPISRIIVGARMSPAMITALDLICSQYGIKVDRTVIADWGIYTMGLQR
ncbi:MAG TPA: DUF2971 domain-containing protein [Thermoanaerobaculia bacterium]|nr:DUF2971 domain-containing protein [Thermoanaerobaculia bacterium]